MDNKNFNFNLQLFGYTDAISRSNVASLIPPEVSADVIEGVAKQSTALSMLSRLDDMSTDQLTLDVTSALPQAYFVDGDTGLMQTSKIEWADKYIYAEKLGVIVPIPNNVLADVKRDIWGECKPKLIEAMGKAIDAAIFFGTGKPTRWPDGIVTAAVSAGNSVKRGSLSDLADEIGAEGGLMNKVELSGYDVNGFAASTTMKSVLRGLRSADGLLIYQPSLQTGTPSMLYGQTLVFPDNGAWNSSSAYVIGGDFKAAKYSMRRDITWKLLDQATLQDAAGNIVYNLAQQDMVAIVATMRLGWQVPNPINRIQEIEASRYPFAVIIP